MIKLNKQKLIRLLCVVLMFISSALIIIGLVSTSGKFKVGNIISHASLFLVGAFYLYLNLRSEHRTKK
jgi:hypothetical protein